MKLLPISKLTTSTIADALANNAVIEISKQTDVYGTYNSFKITMSDLTSYIDQCILTKINELKTNIGQNYLPLGGGELTGDLTCNTSIITNNCRVNGNFTVPNNITINATGITVGSSANTKIDASTGAITAGSIHTTNLTADAIAQLTAQHALWS